MSLNPALTRFGLYAPLYAGAVSKMRPAFQGSPLALSGLSDKGVGLLGKFGGAAGELQAGHEDRGAGDKRSGPIQAAFGRGRWLKNP